MSALPPLVLGSDEARTFQQLIKEELTRRHWSDGDDDEVMAEYIGVMVANNKTAAQIATELEELVGDATAEGSGSDGVKEFVDWLWHQRATLGTRNDVAMEGQSATVSSDAKSREQWRASETKRRSLSPESRSRRGEEVLIQERIAEEDRRNQRGGDRWRDERQRRDQGNVHDRSGRYPQRDRYIPDAQNSRGPMVSNAIPQSRNAGRELFGGQNGNGNGHAAMDDPSLPAKPEPTTTLRIQGQGSNHLFQRSLAQASRQQNQQSAQSAQSASLFSRVSMPDPRAQEFVPSSQVQGPASEPNVNLLSRLDPMMPNNQLPSTLPVNDGLTTMQDSSFPTQPSDPSLCRYSLGCTNPMCNFSHPSASAVSQHQKTGKEPLVLRQEPCRFQKDCTNAECSFSHVSPAVTFVLAKAERNLDTLGISTAVSCHFQMECKNPACTYAHYDPTTGQVVPSPATQSSATSANDIKQCRFGNDCTRKDCHFLHPPGHSLHISDRLSQFGGSNQMDGEMEVIIPAAS